MEYQATILTNGVDLTRPSIHRYIKNDLYAALVCVIIAFVAYFTGSGSEESTVAISVFLVACVLCILFMSRAFTRKGWERIPDRVRFDNEKSMLEIYHQRSIAKVIEIPYGRVKSISPRLYTRHTRSDRRRSEWYAVAIYLKDGSMWDLTDDCFAHIDFAERWIEKWRKGVELNDSLTSSATLPKIQTETLSISHRGEELQIHWRNYFPYNMFARLLAPTIGLAFVCGMGFMLMSTEGPDWGTLIARLKKITSASDLPEALNGFMFVLPPFIAFLTWFSVEIVRIANFKTRKNRIIVKRSQLNSAGLDIPASEIGAISFDYSMNRKQSGIQFMREMLHQDQQKVIAQEVEVSEAADTNTVFQKLTNGDELSFTSWLKSIPSQMEEARIISKVAEENILGFISYYKFSPLDIYIVRENICRELRFQMKEPSAHG